MITDKIKKIEPYFREMVSDEGCKCISVKFPDNWTVLTNDRIGYNRSNKNNLIVFYSNFPEISYDEIVDFIFSVVTKNIEAEEKNKMLNEVITNLSNLFSQKDLKDLKKMDFSFEKTKKKVKNKVSEKPTIVEVETVGEISILVENNENISGE